MKDYIWDIRGKEETVLAPELCGLSKWKDEVDTKWIK